MTKSVAEQRPRPVSYHATSLVQCELCSEQVDELTAHATSTKHMEKGLVVNNYVAYCDLRRICPVTCDLSDLLFYLEYCIPKTLVNSSKKYLGDVKYLNILAVLDRIHDQDIICSSEIANQVQNLIAKGLQRPIAFICYSCPSFAENYDELSSHVTSSEHQAQVQNLGQNLQIGCEPCNKFFKDLAWLDLHLFSKEHLINSKAPNAGFVRPELSISRPENYCILCKIPSVDLSHLQNPEHKSKAKILKKYLQFCASENINPVEPGSNQSKVGAWIEECVSNSKFTIHEMTAALRQIFNTFYIFLDIFLMMLSFILACTICKNISSHLLLNPVL